MALTGLQVKTDVDAFVNKFLKTFKAWEKQPPERGDEGDPELGRRVLGRMVKQAVEIGLLIFRQKQEYMWDWNVADKGPAG